MLGGLYEEWNARINLISRRDIDFYTHHVLHSLAIAKCMQFPVASTVLDAGTGGGFPGIPLAIMFPQTQFTLADSIGKKIMAVKSIAASLKLQNVEAVNGRVEDLQQRFDFTVCRAVAVIPILLGWIGSKTNKGIFFLKGGDISDELKSIPQKAQIFDIAQWFEEAFFEEKKIVKIIDN
jgi:16S rRNA (guanine527-N7)-methyltransferase